MDGLPQWTALKTKSGRSKGKRLNDLENWICTVSRNKKDDLKGWNWMVLRNTTGRFKGQNWTVYICDRFKMLVSVTNINAVSQRYKLNVSASSFCPTFCGTLSNVVIQKTLSFCRQDILENRIKVSRCGIWIFIFSLTLEKVLCSAYWIDFLNLSRWNKVFHFSLFGCHLRKLTLELLSLQHFRS